MLGAKRAFGKYTGKRSENHADTQSVLTEFKEVDDMLDRVC